MSKMTLNSALSQAAMGLLLLLGIACAIFGIGMMRAVAFVEAVCARLALPGPFHPAIGGIIVGLLALVMPHVLASGHGALFELFRPNAGPSDVILVTLLLKAAASVVSLGTGFRGGLFFASLFLGGMIGRVYFFGVEYIDPSLAPDVNVCASSGWQRLPLRSSARR